jgi:hypothetical protein
MAASKNKSEEIRTITEPGEISADSEGHGMGQQSPLMKVERRPCYEGEVMVMMEGAPSIREFPVPSNSAVPA